MHTNFIFSNQNNLAYHPGQVLPPSASGDGSPLGCEQQYKEPQPEPAMKFPTFSS